MFYQPDQCWNTFNVRLLGGEWWRDWCLGLRQRDAGVSCLECPTIIGTISTHANVIPTLTVDNGALQNIIQQKYDGHSINKLQNGAIPLILKIEKIWNICFVGNLILKIHINFFDDDVIIVTSSVHRTHSICVLFSPVVFYHNSQVINSIGTRTKRISLTS